MIPTGKLIIVLGVLMLIIGVAIWALGRLGFRGLPGDIRYESENVRFYFPIVSCIVLFVILTLGLWLWHRLSQK
jgi:sterol desaturase/sphingolipid hydroxylase (fatty acid hydroxylase superfamily)